MTYVERLYLLDRLHRLIRRKGTGTPGELANRLEVSKRTVFNHLNILRELGANICYCNERCSYFYESDIVFNFIPTIDTDQIKGGQAGRFFRDCKIVAVEANSFTMSNERLVPIATKTSGKRMHKQFNTTRFIDKLFGWQNLRLILACGLLFGFLFIQAQNAYPKGFGLLIHKADSCELLGEFAAAGHFMDEALAQNGGKYPDAAFYQMAFYHWFDAGNMDKALFYLEKCMQFGSQSKEAIWELENEAEYAPLRAQDEFTRVVGLYYHKMEKYGGVIDTLATIRKKDQVLRQLLGCAKDKYGEDSLSLSLFYDLIERQDDENLSVVAPILEKHGWLGINKVGEDANRTLWLVIQHSPLDVQEEYIPLLRASVERGETRMARLAFLQDRILMKRGQPQLYGTQMVTHPVTKEKCVFPVQDPKGLAERRAAVGFEPIQDYASFFDVVIESLDDLNDPVVLEYWRNNYVK
ncbi:MAG: helix-turn-helix domain-containing protein [Bacteroidota bacterium]